MSTQFQGRVCIPLLTPVGSMASSAPSDFAHRLLVTVALFTVLLLPRMTGPGSTSLVSANHTQMQMQEHAASISVLQGKPFPMRKLLAGRSPRDPLAGFRTPPIQGMSKIAKVVKRVPKNPFGHHDSLLRSSGWLQAKPTSEQAWPAAESSSKPSLNYLAMQHIFRSRNHLDFNADAVLQSVCHFAKQDTASSLLPQATSRGNVPARRGGTSLGGSHYPRLLFQDVNLQQYLSTIQPPRKNSTGLRPGRVIVHHYPKRTAVHVFTPDDVEPETWKQVANALSSQSNTSVFLKAVKLQSIYQSASLIAQDICLQLEQRKQFRAITQALFKKLKKVPYVEGIRVICSGRINGALIARSDRRGFGPLTLQSFSAQVDYAQAQAQLPYGILGIKVWVSYL